MQFSQAQVGRVFVIRLEHGERMPDALETFCAEHDLRAGVAFMVGGADEGSRFVVGPKDGAASPVVPMVTALAGAHEAAAGGTIFPDETGQPVLHMHAAFGRGEETRAGCIRAGIVTWHILELVVFELVGAEMARMPDEATGFRLLRRV